MLFFHPMWDHESERIGKRMCTPAGYALHVAADWIGLLGLGLLFVTPTAVVQRWMVGTFHASLMWLVTIPLGVGLISEVLYQLSWWLAARRGFHFDPERCEASWLEAGQRQSYRYRG